MTKQSPAAAGWTGGVGKNVTTPAASDMVNHPSHYTSHPSGVECIDVVQHMTFNAGNAMKYLWRAGLKGAGEKEIEDLKKAEFYVRQEIKRLEQST